MLLLVAVLVFAAVSYTHLDVYKRQGVGDIIKITIKEAIPRGKVKKGDVLKAVVAVSYTHLPTWWW